MPISHPLSLLGLLSASAAVRIGRGKKVLEVVRGGVGVVRGRIGNLGNIGSLGIVAYCFL